MESSCVHSLTTRLSCGFPSKYMSLTLYISLLQVIKDDYLPMSQHGELLCSLSNNKNELRVSLQIYDLDLVHFS